MRHFASVVLLLAWGPSRASPGSDDVNARRYDAHQDHNGRWRLLQLSLRILRAAVRERTPPLLPLDIQ